MTKAKLPIEVNYPKKSRRLRKPQPKQSARSKKAQATKRRNAILDSYNTFHGLAELIGEANTNYYGGGTFVEKPATLFRDIRAMREQHTETLGLLFNMAECINKLEATALGVIG